MSLTDTLPPAFEYIADRITRPVDFSTKQYLVAASQAFHVSQTHERRGRALETQGDWSSGGTSTSTSSSNGRDWDCNALLSATFSSTNKAKDCQQPVRPRLHLPAAAIGPNLSPTDLSAPATPSILRIRPGQSATPFDPVPRRRGLVSQRADR